MRRRDHLGGLVDYRFGDEVAELPFGRKKRLDLAPEHLIASCGYLPDFPPLEIDGRLLGDGGLIANTPVEQALDWNDAEGDWTIFVVDLFQRASARPTRLEEAAGRRNDLLFANQTRQALQLFEREIQARGLSERLRVIRLAYRAPSH